MMVPESNLATTERKQQMQLKKMIMALAAGSLAITAQGLTLSVKDVKIAQRYPWNGLVDIDYTVVCDEPATNIWVYPVGYDADFNVSVAPRTLEGEGANGQPVTVGAEGEKTFRMTWNMAADMPANYNRAKFSMKMHAYAGAAPYMVIDLSPGSSAEKYDVTYLTEIPDGEWSDEYKTSKLVLKLIPSGTMKMGEQSVNIDTLQWWPNSVSSSYNVFGSSTVQDVTLLKPFYFSIFPLTKNQYKLLMGGSDSGTSPKVSLSYTNIRGGTLGRQYPDSMQVDADSLLGVIRTKTGITFDIPTDAQWEFAARAFESASYADEWNGFGLYKMTGWVGCWCRNWFSSEAISGVEPKGPASGQSRSIRGYIPCSTANSSGGTGVAYESRIAARNGGMEHWNKGWYWTYFVDYANSNVGCRLVALPAE